MAEQSVRPKRRDLRIARQEAERRAAEISISSTKVDFDAETLVIPQVVLANPQKKTKKGWVPYLSAASVAVVVATVAVLSNDGLPASADERAESDKVASQNFVTDSGTTPPSLLFDSSSADVARYHDYESEYTGETYTCQAPSGASSLSNLFMEQAEVVVDPMAAGTYRMVSGFGYRTDPVFGGIAMHKGVDYAGKLGTPIYAMADGIVVRAGEGNSWQSGDVIAIEHEIDGKTYQSWYLHLYSDDIKVEVGDKVKAGQHIAGVGNKGKSTGPHLHFEVHDGSYYDENYGTAIDPLSFLREKDAVDIANMCE